MEVAFICLTVVAIAALGLLAFAIREFKLQFGSLSASAFDRLQAKSLAEVAATEHARATNTVAIRNLQDALAQKPGAQKPEPKRRVTALNGNTYNEDELEAL